MDWPHDWYSGKNALTQLLKRLMYFRGLRKLRQFPCVWTAHNLISHDASDVSDEHKMIQLLIDCCDGIVVMSHAAEERLVDTYDIPVSTNVGVVPHGHYIDVYRNDASQSDAREILGLKGVSRVVLSLGRILPYKGLDELIVSFCRVAREGYCLIIAGPVADRSLLEYLNSLVAQLCPKGLRIIIRPGFVQDDDLQYYFNASDIVALPFRDILNSGSLLLAMSFGRCVVAPRLGSIAEVADPDGLYGYDADNENGLSDALAAALDANDLLTRGQKSRDFVKEHYSWDRVGREVRSIYNDILE
jgi:glycosyltransferase involved in cell wall biosynthesis